MRLVAAGREAHTGAMPDNDLLNRPKTASAPSGENGPSGDIAGRSLPANLEAEAAFLGAVLIDNGLIEELSMPLLAEHFFAPVHQRIYDRILTLIDRQMVVTPVTLKPYFDGDEALAELGGTSYLMRLTADGQGLLAVRDLARQIYDLALLRELASVGRHLVEGALDTSQEVEPMKQIEQAEASLYRVAEGSVTESQTTSFRDASITAIKMAEAAMASGGGLSGKTTGLETIDSKTAGLHNSDLIILAGRPGMGKTSLATNIAFNCAAKHLEWEHEGGEFNYGAPTAFFSLEMSADQLATRILAEQAEISSENLRSGKLTREEFLELSRASQRLAKLPLYIDDTPALTIGALRTRARRLKRRHDIGLIVVDYLQLLQGSGRANDNRVNEISEISRGLKTLAKELQVPVLALSQLSRAVEQRDDKRPQLADLRESGTIEQDADIVLFVYRDEYYHAMKRPDIEDVEKHAKWLEKAENLNGLAEVIVAKQRHGSTGIVELLFDKNVTKFKDRAPDSWRADYSG